MKVFALTVACALLCNAGVLAQGKSTPLADQKFIRAALAAGTTEIKEGAEFSDSGNTRVQTFATRMVKDHSEANTQLLALAHQLNVTVPNSTLPESGESEQSPIPQSTSPQSKHDVGVTPKAYFTKQVAAHEQVVALFKKEIADGGSSQVKAYAQRSLPMLETHLALAQKDLKAVSR